jgi:hypothetical protein
LKRNCKTVNRKLTRGLEGVKRLIPSAGQRGF